jgi:hypothetical protein
VQVHSNGIVEVGNNIDPMSRSFQNDTFQNHTYTFIAPFYGDVHAGGDTSCGEGVVKYVVITDGTALEKVKLQIQKAFPDHKEFSPEYLVVATWDGVGYYKEKVDKRNTFQCVVTTDGTTSFAIFLYNEIEWTTADDDRGPAKVGFNDYKGVNLNQSWEMPCSGTSDITQLNTSSNVGTPGLWIFRIDGENIIPACPNEASCTSDRLCSCLTDDPRLCHSQCQRSTEKLVCTKTDRTDTPSTEGVESGADSTHTLPFMVFSVAIIVSVACVCLRAVPTLRSTGPKVKGE